jgi:hypothetical protein
MTSILDRALPANLDAERFVLGSIVLNDTIYPQVEGAIGPDDFSLEKHRRIYARMKDLVWPKNQNDPDEPNSLTSSSRLERKQPNIKGSHTREPVANSRLFRRHAWRAGEHAAESGNQVNAISDASHYGWGLFSGGLERSSP